MKAMKKASDAIFSAMYERGQRQGPRGGKLRGTSAEERPLVDAYVRAWTVAGEELAARLRAIGTGPAAIRPFLDVEHEFWWFQHCIRLPGMPAPAITGAMVRATGERLVPSIGAYIAQEKQSARTAQDLNSNTYALQGSFTLAGPQGVAQSQVAALRPAIEQRNLADQNAAAAGKRAQVAAADAAEKAHQAELARTGPDTPALEAALARAFRAAHPNVSLVGNSIRANGSEVTMNAGPAQESYGFQLLQKPRCTSAGAGTFRCAYNLVVTAGSQIMGLSLPKTTYLSTQRTDLVKLAGGAWEVEGVRPYFNQYIAGARTAAAARMPDPATGNNREKCNQAVYGDLMSGETGSAAARSLGCF